MGHFNMGLRPRTLRPINMKKVGYFYRLTTVGYYFGRYDSSSARRAHINFIIIKCLYMQMKNNYNLDYNIIV